MDQAEEAHLSQLGKDRRLGEAVDNLDLAAAELVRTCGNENAPEEDVLQAAANYRAAVTRRNGAFDKSAGVDEGEVAAAAGSGLDPESLKAMIDEAVGNATPQGEGATAPDEETLRKLIASVVGEQKGEIVAEAVKAVEAEIAKGAAGATPPKASGGSGSSSSSQSGEGKGS